MSTKRWPFKNETWKRRKRAEQKRSTRQYNVTPTNPPIRTLRSSPNPAQRLTIPQPKRLSRAEGGRARSALSRAAFTAWAQLMEKAKQALEKAKPKKQRAPKKKQIRLPSR